jgi:hypothetical protein
MLVLLVLLVLGIHVVAVGAVVVAEVLRTALMVHLATLEY